MVSTQDLTTRATVMVSGSTRTMVLTQKVQLNFLPTLFCILCFVDQVHLGIILVNDQLDAQFFFHIYLFQISTCFEHLWAHHQEN